MQVKKDDIRSNIIGVAQRLFIKRGYENTSLMMIAGRCHISKSNIYRYFGSKEEIYETIVGPARDEIRKRSAFFFSEELINKDVADKCEEVPVVLTGLLYRFRQEILIVLRSEESKDRKLIEHLITESFVSTCPIGERGAKELISKMLMFGLTGILMEHGDEESIGREVRSLIRYHYLGLNGLKGYAAEGR